MEQLPPKYLEIEQKLGEPLAQFVADRRKGNVAWRRIAAEIGERTAVKVSHEALRMWVLGREPVAGASSP